MEKDVSMDDTAYGRQKIQFLEQISAIPALSQAQLHEAREALDDAGIMSKEQSEYM